MHFRVEVIMPPTDKVEEQLAAIMQPFDEQYEPADPDEECKLPGWWDWYVIGGRWAGTKCSDLLDPDELKRFYAQVEEERLLWRSKKVDAEGQDARVHELYRSYFPNKGRLCPFMGRGMQAQYNDTPVGDTWLLKDVALTATCNKCLIATPRFDEGIGAESLFQHDIWNGVNFQDSDWDCTIGQALERHNERAQHYKEEYRDRHTPKDDWLVVTVDCHN